MKARKLVSAALIAGVVATGAACSTNNSNSPGQYGYESSHRSVCVDKKTKKRVSDSSCNTTGNRYTWWYLNPGQPTPAIGKSPIKGGYTKPAAKVQLAPESGAPKATKKATPKPAAPTKKAEKKKAGKKNTWYKKTSPAKTTKK